MKTYLRIIGAISLCLLSQQIQASGISQEDTQHRLVEKGAKSKSKAKIELDGLPSGKGSSCGPKGCTGPVGPKCRPVYAAAFQESPKNFGIPSVGDIITLPFTTLDYSRGITLDALTDTFTLPKGMYTVRFQFMRHGEDDNITFSSIYLDIGGFQHPLTWNASEYDPASSSSIVSFSGASLFEVPIDDTQVQIRMLVGALDSSPDELIFVDSGTPLNYPTRVVFEQITTDD